MPTRCPTHLMRQSVTVETYTTTADAGGSPIKTWASSLTGVICDIQQMNGNEAARYGRPATARLYNVYLQSGQSIAETARLLWGSKYLQILNVIDYDSQTRLTRMVCEEQPGRSS